MRFPQNPKWNYVYQYLVGELHRGQYYSITKPSFDIIANSNYGNRNLWCIGTLVTKQIYNITK